MKHIQKYLKTIWFMFIALVWATFVIVYASGTKNIVYDSNVSWILSRDWVSYTNSGFKLGIDDYMIIEKDTVNHTCKYYQGLTANKVYVPNYREWELDAFNAHFPTGFLENQTVATPYCNYEDESLRTYAPIGCYNSSWMNNLSFPISYNTIENTSYYNDNNANFSWNCPSLESNPCEETISCNVSPCSPTWCAAGALIEWTDDAHRSCSFEDRTMDETYHEFSCEVPSVCGTTAQECLWNTAWSSTQSPIDWTCLSNWSNGYTSCSITVCSSWHWETNSSCAWWASYVDDSYDGSSSWQCDFEGTSYSCPGN
jgi:hypothetical protein